MALAVVLGLGGLAVLGTSERLASAAEPLEAGLATDGSDLASPSAGDRVGDALLGTGEVRRYLEALELARASSDTRQTADAVLELRARAEAELGAIVVDGGDQIMRSRASNLLGVLLLEDAKSARSSPRRYLDQAIGAFQDAVRLDPSYAEAKANLQLLQLIPAGTMFRREGDSGPEASSSGSGESGY
jgi:hypothetical protein